MLLISTVCVLSYSVSRKEVNVCCRDWVVSVRLRAADDGVQPQAELVDGYELRLNTLSRRVVGLDGFKGGARAVGVAEKAEGEVDVVAVLLAAESSGGRLVRQRLAGRARLKGDVSGEAELDGAVVNGIHS